MKVHEFCVIASGLDPTADDFETRFYDAGCDDATISFQRGQIIVDFSREADTLEDAIASAISDTTRAGAHVDHVEPDPLVSLSDIANRTNMTRAAISLYAKAQRGKDFPAPVARVTSESPLWDWASVAQWLFKNDKLSGEQVIEAAVVKSANDALRSGQVPTRDILLRSASQLELTR